MKKNTHTVKNCDDFSLTWAFDNTLSIRNMATNLLTISALLWFIYFRLLSSGLCNNTLTASALRANPQKLDPHRTVRVVFPDQSTDAIIYVTVVIVFYAAIILILVGTNLHRFRRNDRTRNNGPSDDEEESVELEEKRHLVVHLDKNARVYQTVTPEKVNELAL